MKFTKTAVAVAIAGIAAVPMVASADTTLSGVVEIKLTGDDGDADASDPKIAAGDVFMGIVSEHELNSGLTGYGSLRYDLNSLSNGNDSTGADNVYVGIKGGFGDVRFGEVPVVAEYGQVAGDLHDQTGKDIDGGMSYTGTFGSFGLGLNLALENNQAEALRDGRERGMRAGIGAKFSVGGFAVGVGAEQHGDDETNASVGASFGLGGASIAAHYWVQQPDGAGDDPTAIAVKVGYGFGGVAASLTFSQAENVADFESKMRLDLSYGLGGGLTLSSRININSDTTVADDPATLDVNESDDLTDWRIQLAKTF